MTIENRLKTLLARGELATSMIVRHARSAEIALVAYTAGYDALYVDLEHSPLTLETVSNICIAATGHGVTPLVRVPGHDAALIARVLDSGAMGVIVPGIEDSNQALEVVENALFPPQGRRSITSGLPQLRFNPSTPQTLEEVNKATLVAVMIETPNALKNAEAIAAVPGIDLLHIGLHDLSASLGLQDRPASAVMQDILLPVITAAQRQGKHVGVGGATGDRDLLKALVDAGVRYVSVGSDIGFLLAAASERGQSVRDLYRPTDATRKQR